MSVEDPRGFASPVDRARYGNYVSKPDKGVHSLNGYEVRSRFRDRISTDGSTPYTPESGRYHVYLALGCPWAQRVAIAIELQGLGNAISWSLVDDLRDGRGWAFRERRGCDPINDFGFLRQAYLATDPTFKGHVNVPTLWDRKTGRVVNNDDSDIFLDVVTQFRSIAPDATDLHPSAHRSAIDMLDIEIHENLNFGVYAAAIKADQASYDASVRLMFDTLDRLDGRLATSRYLFGDVVVETDIRLWVTLARFDIVYNPFFKCSIRRLVDYPNLWAYARDLYSLPAFSALADFDAMKLSYYGGFPQWNPSGIVPQGPVLDWLEPQDRSRLAKAAAA